MSESKFSSATSRGSVPSVGGGTPFGYDTPAPSSCTHVGWTDDRVERLRALWKDGFSASQIAAKLGGITRNAVIGKANRLGLEGRARPSAPARPKVVTPPRSRTFSRIAMTPAVSPVIPLKPSKSEPVPTRTFKPGVHACGMADLGDHQCRWPLGPMLEPSRLFCGEPLDEDRDRNLPPYCPAHAERSKSQQARKVSPSELARSLRRYISAKAAA